MSLFFDTGPIISLTMNNLLWILDELKKHYKGDFIVTPSVKEELIDNPLKIKRFRLEAIQVLHAVRKGTLTIIEEHVDADELLNLANSIYRADGERIKIVSRGEMSVLAHALNESVHDVVIDERTVRLLVEDYKQLAKLLRVRLKRKININHGTAKRFTEMVKGLAIFRSCELVLVAFKKGYLNHLIPKEGKETLVDALLWGLKTKGCAISEKELEEMKRLVV